MPKERSDGNSPGNCRLPTGHNDSNVLTPNFCPFCGSTAVEQDAIMLPSITVASLSGEIALEHYEATRWNCYGCRKTFYLEE